MEQQNEIISTVVRRDLKIRATTNDTVNQFSLANYNFNRRVPHYDT